LTSLLLTMNMASTLFGISVEECLAGVTRNAARALGLEAQTGSLAAGKRADIAIWDAGRPAELVYRIGFNPLHRRISGGAMDEPRRSNR
jgi:imidazolonepropionase